jgi:hypothetical protein
MYLEKEECDHFQSVLQKTKEALTHKDATALRELSNQTIHSACNFQDSGSITIAVLIYALSKLVEREDYRKLKNWDAIIKKLNGILDIASKALVQKNFDAYEIYIKKSRQLLESLSVNLKPYIQDVLKKASINKGSKIYEHGISLEQTSKLLGITQWELSDYIGQRSVDVKQVQTIDVKKRAKMALEFFS